MNIDTITLTHATGCTPERAARFAFHLDQACRHYSINTPLRLAHFLAQTGHESGSLRWVREIWGPTPAQTRYEGRADLGNIRPGDGPRYLGRGLIHTTGRANYRRVAERLRTHGAPDFEAEPERLEIPEWAAWSAADYWDMRNINAAADADDLERVTRLVNGGLNGLEDRRRRLAAARAALGAAAPAAPEETAEAEPPAPAPEPHIISAPVHTKPAAPPPAPWWRRLSHVLQRGSALPPAPPQEQQAMPIALAPFVAAALPSIIDAIPRLGKLFSSGSPTSERNVKAAELVVELVREATGSQNVQEAAEKVTSDPAARQQAEAAVSAHWLELTEAGGGGVQGARKADAAAAAAGSIWKSPSLIVGLALLPLVYMVVGAVVGLFGEPFSEDVRAAIANGIVGLILGGLIGYYFGQSTSRNRTAPPQ